MVKYSIIIPNYNKGKYVEKCLNSIMNQTISKDKIEVIVIDDGSEDESLSIIKKYPVKLLFSKRMGAGGARNKGFDEATGEYIILLDSDDYFYQNNSLELLDNKLKEEDFVFVACQKISKDKKIIFSENSQLSMNEQIENSSNFCLTLKVFKHSLINDIRYKEMEYHEDILFCMNIMCKAQSLLYFEEIFYVYFTNTDKNTITSYSLEKATDFVSQTLGFYKLFDKYPEARKSLMSRINQEEYIKKIKKLNKWITNQKTYTYREFLDGDIE